ncbi:MAG: DUF3127 domain-containing protein [Bacteroidales bacterium]|jgi:hypothetical protein|nr:DUF3127 domain-containing protein [Bacteroidales bacterium]MDD4703539.1 DUF3127 domain-containing protein [Bacteroidales bacterium]MDX9798074.1 DUF3127 domain-containing protein [Bacteroidales bacterium]
MEIIGKFLKTLPEQSGESQRGPWVRGGFVIETEEQFPKQVAFSLWGEDKVAIVRTMPIGTQIKVFFSPESREYQDRWYTDLRCFRIDTFNPITSAGAQEQQSPSYSAPKPQAPSAPSQSAPLESDPAENYGSFNTQEPSADDDLPF